MPKLKRLFKAAEALLDTARKPARASQPKTSAHGASNVGRPSSRQHQDLAKQYAFPAIAAVGGIEASS